jgi:hypothetical protein
MINKIMISKYKHHYNCTYHTQIYNLTYILTKIVYFINNHHRWKGLDCCWNNVYKHFIRLSNLNIIDNAFIDILNKYIKKEMEDILK